MKSKEKGDVVVGKAISYYMSHLKEVLIPLGDKQKYDLIIDDGVNLLKVQCKYTSHKSKYGISIVPLRVMGGNRSYHTATKYEKKDFDILFVVTSDGEMYEIPFDIITSQNCCSLGEKFKKYKVL